MDRQSNQDHIKNGLANMGGGFMEALGLRQCGLFSQKKVTYWGVKLNHNPSQNG
jgi:hypothetical protein